tara:strand:- start:267 stop:1025 length:759 start_codon:yes stop_codon:yes gene_type:complete
MFYSKQLIKYPKIKHCFFSSKNGVSKNIYKSLNCGIGSNDKRKNVIKNLKIISKKIGCKYKNLITMNQTHSNNVKFINKNLLNKNKIACDAILTNKKELCISVLTADCVPILIYDPVNNIIAAIHAGWKGAYKGIIQNTIKKLIKNGSIRKNLIVAIGPSISQKNYEVSLPFYKKFIKKNKINKIFFKIKKSMFFFNLRKYVDYQFKLSRVTNTNHVNLDTFDQKNNFFSRRRSLFNNQKDYGRNISIIMIK